MEVRILRVSPGPVEVICCKVLQGDDLSLQCIKIPLVVDALLD